MLRQIINFSEAESTAVGINLLQGKAPGTEYTFCILRRTKDQLHVISIGTETTPQLVYQQIELFLSKGARVHFNLEGKGILQRETTEKVIDLKEVLIQFPGIEKKEFIPQVCYGAVKSFLSIVRRDTLIQNELYALVKNNVSAISIGPYVLSALKPIVASNEISYNEQKFIFNNEMLERIEASSYVADSTVTVGSQEVKQESLLAFASAVNVFLPTPHLRIEQLPEADVVRDEFQIKRRTFRFGQVLLGGLLTILLINTVIFFQLKSAVSSIQDEVSGYEHVYQKDEARQAKAVLIEKVFSSTGWNSNDEPLMFADQLGASVPHQIELLKLEIGVLDEALYRKEKRHQFQPQVLRIQGYAENPAALTTWISAIEKLIWTDRVENQHYQHDLRKGKGMFEFIVYTK